MTRFPDPVYVPPEKCIPLPLLPTGEEVPDKVTVPVVAGLHELAISTPSAVLPILFAVPVTVMVPDPLTIHPAAEPEIRTPLLELPLREVPVIEIGPFPIAVVIVFTGPEILTP